MKTEIGFRIKINALEENSFIQVMEEYYKRFKTCEIKVKGPIPISTVKWYLEKINEISEGKFSVHLPKNMLKDENEEELSKWVFQILKQIEPKKEVMLVTHMPVNFKEKDIAKLEEISKQLPNNCYLLLENIETSDNCKYFKKIDEVMKKLKQKKIKNIFICLDIGHLLYSANLEGKKQKIALNMLEANKNVIKNIKEIHIHDFNYKQAHLNLNNGMLELENVAKFLEENNIKSKIIIESNIEGFENAEKEVQILKKVLPKMNIEQINDIEQILELHYKIFGEKFIMSGYEKKKQQYKLYMYLFKDESIPIGYGVIVDKSEEKTLYVWYAGVIPEYQGKGLVSIFFQKTINLATEKSYAKVTTATTNLRPNMMKLLIKNNFDIFDIKKREEHEGNKIYFKYDILPPTTMEIIDKNNELVEIERALVRNLKNNCQTIKMDSTRLKTVEYVIKYCNNFYRKPMIILIKNEMVITNIKNLEKIYLGKIKMQ